MILFAFKILFLKFKYLTKEKLTALRKSIKFES